MRYKCLISVAFALLLISATNTLADTKKIWNQMPLPIHLPVGHEIRVIFPAPVDLQVPAAIATRLQSLAPNSTMVYWKALEDIEPARIIASSHDGKEIYVLDISASKNGLVDNIMIEDPRRILEEVAITDSGQSIPALKDPAEIVLTRFASQSLYAPARLIPSDAYVMPLETPSLPADFPLMRSSMGEAFRVEPVAQWLGYERYITAVLIQNLSPFSVPIKMQNVRGNFTHATPQHLTLGATGTLEDRTTLFLISDIPFQEAVLSDGYDY